jgi:hypothetical protein
VPQSTNIWQHSKIRISCIAINSKLSKRGHIYRPLEISFYQVERVLPNVGQFVCLYWTTNCKIIGSYPGVHDL